MQTTTSHITRCARGVASTGLGVLVLVLGLAGCGDEQRAEDTPSPSALSPQQAAEAFVALARDQPDGVPWAEEVGYSIAGEAVRTFGPEDSSVEALTTCPEGQVELEGRACPVSPLDTVAMLSADPVVEPGTPQVVGCHRFASPPVPDGLRPVTIRPPEDARDCFGDFAVSLYVDEAGAVQWIDFTLSGP